MKIICHSETIHIQGLRNIVGHHFPPALWFSFGCFCGMLARPGFVYHTYAVRSEASLVSVFCSETLQQGGWNGSVMYSMCGHARLCRQTPTGGSTNLPHNQTTTSVSERKDSPCRSRMCPDMGVYTVMWPCSAPPQLLCNPHVSHLLPLKLLTWI